MPRFHIDHSEVNYYYRTKTYAGDGEDFQHKGYYSSFGDDVKNADLFADFHVIKDRKTLSKSTFPANFQVEK